MGYLSNFKYDVFLSYAHADNKTIDETEDGWITKFYKQFKLQLDRYLEGVNTAEIWSDHELRKNYAFDDKIQDVIKNSAIFLAFTSNSFYRSEYCCEKELKLFYGCASGSGLGLKVNDYRRIFNIQLLNRPYQTWPEEFQGGDKYAMFKYSNAKSLKKEEDQGITLNPEVDYTEYESRVIEIVQDVCKTLHEIKNKEANEVVLENQAPKKVFLGKVAHTLLSMRDQIASELEANKISVYKCDVPPPYDKEEHKNEVTKKMLESGVSVHLFDAIAGDKIVAGYPYTFLQEQAFLGKELKKEQFIFIPQELDIEKIEDRVHAKFLSDFLINKSPESNYNFIREFSVPAIIDHIKEKIAEPLPSPIGNNFILLDYNEVDYKYAVEFYNTLMAENKKIYLTVPGGGPFDGIKKFENALKQVTSVIIVCVTVAQEWLKERIIEIIRAIRTEK
ncbi:MAG: hypothetical protein ABI861_09695, partial [Panacibacter sp.]